MGGVGVGGGGEGGRHAPPARGAGSGAHAVGRRWDEALAIVAQLWRGAFDPMHADISPRLARLYPAIILSYIAALLDHHSTLLYYYINYTTNSTTIPLYYTKLHYYIILLY